LPGRRHRLQQDRQPGLPKQRRRHRGQPGQLQGDTINDGRVISNFIVQALTGQELTIYGQGLQTRSFCYVSDLVEGLVRLMNYDTFEGPVNLGNPEEFTILELAQKVLELTRSKSPLVFKPLPQDDPQQRCPNISKAQAQLGWCPTITLTEGLNATIPYFADKLKPLG
ncbi:MAG: GDP-mannose 4,6-dehydratase, partial [Desulfobacca sp.]|nr:GDP-mannose 4,6-dehydratase [Desulfobacca sp.]